MVMNENIQERYFMVHLFLHGKKYIKVSSVDEIKDEKCILICSVSNTQKTCH